MSGFPSISLETQKIFSQALKYTGILLTTALGVYSLSRKTVIESSNPLQPNSFTRAGKRYLRGLIILTVFTSAVAIWDDHIDGKLKEEASAKGSATIIQGVVGTIEPDIERQKQELGQSLEDQKKAITRTTKELRDNIAGVTHSLDKAIDGSSRRLESRLSDAVDNLSSANDPLEYVRIKFMPHRMREDEDELRAWIPDLNIAEQGGFMSNHPAESRLKIISEHTHDDVCPSNKCKFYMTHYKNYIYGRPFAAHFDGAFGQVQWVITFRGLIVRIELTTCTVGNPVVYTKDRLVVDEADFIPYRCLNVIAVNQGFHGMASDGGDNDVTELQLERELPGLSFNPLSTEASAVNADFDIRKVDVTVCSALEDMTKRYMASKLQEPFDLVVEKRRKNASFGTRLSFRAVPRKPVPLHPLSGICSIVPYEITLESKEEP